MEAEKQIMIVQPVEGEEQCELQNNYQQNNVMNCNNNQMNSVEEPVYESLNNDGADAIEIETETDARNTDNMKLKFKQAKYMIEKTCKNFIQKQEAQKTSSLLLTQQNNHILQKINEARNVVEELKFEGDKLYSQLGRSNEEIAQVEHAVQNSGEIVETLQSYVTTLRCKTKNLIKTRTELFIKVVNHTGSFERASKSKVDRLRRLTKILKDEKKANGGGGGVEDDSIKKENLLLELQIAEKQEKLAKLQARLEKMKINVERSGVLKEEKNRLENDLKQKKDALKDIKNKFDDSVADKKSCVNQLNEELERKIQRIDIVEGKIKEAEEKTTDSNVKGQNAQENINMNRKLRADILENINKAMEEISEKEKKLNEITEEHTKKLDTLKTDLNTSDNNKAVLVEKIKYMTECAEMRVKTYFSKLEENNTLKNKKLVLQDEFNAEKLLLVRNQLIVEQIETREGKIKAIRDDLNNISTHKDLTSLSKQIAFLEACQEYLVEKTRNVQDEKDAAEINLKQIADQVCEIKQKIEEKRNDLSNKLKPKADTVAGILKRTNQPKSASTSPKKVQFVNVSSQESASTTENETDNDLMFDKLLESIKNFKKTPAAAQQGKKRRLILD